MVPGSLGLVAVEGIAFWSEVAEACLGLGPVAHDGGRSFCATATSAGLDGTDLIRRC